MAARDTSRDADRVQLAVLRKIGDERRAALALRMSDDARMIARERFRVAQPEADRRAETRALVALFYGEELAARAFAGGK